ncbi:colicin-like bacteriocin tRNase domain-containing protein [Photorhabdus aegyptia]|uniref:colicin-like bacteriocin tRNase domain-containing protein n=1 Tax=Photorhabdus aegyptia TaxID=2805098 RepID=UPI001E572051|nr:colicin-like bacteriocin tRNase domain-containing protein [Photorhabdus aegyptia]MCC8456845.1 hypothetical protein [Photorhabdus aegyptia]
MSEGDRKDYDRNNMQTTESVSSKGEDEDVLANHDTMTVTSSPKSDPGWGGGSGNSGNNERIDRTGKNNGVNLSLFPEAQASAAIGAQPMNIALIDGLWGFTLFQKRIADTVSSILARLGSVALDAAPYAGRFAGVAVGAMWPKSLDVPEGAKFKAERQRMIIQAIQARQVTKTPVSQLTTMSSVVTDIQVQDVIEKDKQTLAIVRTPTETVNVAVVKAEKTKRQHVFTAKVVPGMPPVHIRISDPPKRNIFSRRKEVTPVADVPVKSYTPMPVKNTVDAIVHFPVGSNAEPVYVSVTTVLKPEEVKKQAAEAKRQQEKWEKAHPVEAAERRLYEAEQVFKSLDKIYQEKLKILNQVKNTPEGKALADPVKNPLVYTKDIEIDGKKLKVEIKTDDKKGLDTLLKEGVKAYMLAMTRSDFEKLQDIKDPKEAQLQTSAALLKAIHYERFGHRLLDAWKKINPVQREFNIAMENRKKAEQAKSEVEKNRDKVKEKNKSKNLVIDDKIRDQISSRGWTEKDIKDVVAKGPTGKSTDNRRPNKTPDKLGRNDTATVYGTPPNGYIVVNDRTGEVTQIADKTDSGWNADSRIKWSK